MKTLNLALAVLFLSVPARAQQTLDLSFKRPQPEPVDGGKREDPLARFIAEHLGELESRLEAIVPGMYHPPEEVGTLMKDFKELQYRVHRAGLEGRFGDRIAADLDACDQRLDESLDKDGVVIEYALKRFEGEVKSLLPKAQAAVASGAAEETLPALRERYLTRFHGQDGLLLAMYVSLYRGSTSAGDVLGQGSTMRSLETKVNPAARRMAALAPKVKRLEALLGLDTEAKPSRPMDPFPQRPDLVEESIQHANLALGLDARTARSLGDEIGVAVEAYKPRLPNGLSGVKSAVPPAPVALTPEQERERLFKTRAGLYRGGTALKDELDARLAGYKDRVRGKTVQAGDPYGRAGLVHQQTGETCAVVAQQQVLEELGLLPRGSDVGGELFLAREASPDRDALKEGAPWESWGRLLTERGVLVRTRGDAPNSALEAAAKSGKLVIVDVDAGLLWRQPEFAGSGHAVVVTGADVGRADGRVKGFWINDSGTGEAARYVPAELLYSAFRKRRGRFIAVQ